MNVGQWLYEHLVEPLLPPVEVATDDALFDWVARQQEQVRRELENERDIILRLAREQRDRQTDESETNGHG